MVATLPFKIMFGNLHKLWVRWIWLQVIYSPFFVYFIQFGNNYFHLKTKIFLDGDKQHARALFHQKQTEKVRAAKQELNDPLFRSNHQTFFVIPFLFVSISLYFVFANSLDFFASFWFSLSISSTRMQTLKIILNNDRFC